MRTLPALLTAVACPAAAGCSGDEAAGGSAGPLSSPVGTGGVTGAVTMPATPKVAATLTSGLRAPWGLALLPDGSSLISLRDSAEIVRVADGARTSVGRVEGAVAGGEGGLMGIAVGPDFDTDP